MTAFEKMSSADRVRLERASEWWLRIEGVPAVELSDGFSAWVSDPANAQAYQAVKDAMAALSDFAAMPGILDMRRAALLRLRQGGVRQGIFRNALSRIAAILLFAVIGCGGALYVYWWVPDAYATEAGERRVVALPDGSRISLDSESKVEVRYSKTGRTILLDRGRARFDVAHDVTRPFTVTAGTKTVVAVGTSFNVERLGSTVLVTLIQGHVLVKDAPSSVAIVHRGTQPARPVSLVAGEQMIAQQNVKPLVAPADLADATAWESGRIVFRGEPLNQAVARVNRYTDHAVIVDPSAASVRVSGVFNAGDIGSFVGAITSYFPVQATTDANDRITLEKRS
jgi:transmembrane sensor